MTEKPKSRTTRVFRSTTTDRNSVTGRFVSYSEKASPSSKVIERVRPALGSTEPKKPNTLQARPIDGDVDPYQFAKDLLITDKVIMDYLAR